MADIECVFESMTGKGSIYISNFAAAQNTDLLRKKCIRAILSVARSGFLRHSKEEVPDYLYLPAQDHEEYDIYQFFNQTFDFIEQARRHTNVLVHCMAGVSRSVTIVIAYLLKKFKSSLGEIIMMLQRKRSKINPNKGFIEQLKKYALQEGLRCNFDYQEVPIPRERSFSKGRSKSKEKSKASEYNLTNPLVKAHRDRKLAEMTAETKADINDQAKKNDLNSLSPKKKTTLANEQQQYMVQKQSQIIKQSDSPLKNRHSQDSKSPLCEKRLSIEEKIRKVREKIARKEDMRRSMQKNESLSPKKENRQIPIQIHTKVTTSSKHLSQYFTHYSKQHAESLKSHQKSNSPNRHKEDSSSQKAQFSMFLCVTEGHLIGKELRAQPRNIYSKLQQKRRVMAE